MTTAYWIKSERERLLKHLSGIMFAIDGIQGLDNIDGEDLDPLDILLDRFCEDLSSSMDALIDISQTIDAMRLTQSNEHHKCEGGT